MTPLAQRIAGEIRARGPLCFARYMELALYDAEHGYYRAPRQVFGRAGDFYTAAQLQPVFGRLLRASFEQLWGAPCAGVPVVDWGAGRQDLRAELEPFAYRAVEAGGGGGAPVAGIVFANELFDALPVNVAARVDGVWRERLVTLAGDGGFTWCDGAALDGAWLDYARRATESVEGDITLELPVAMRATLERIDRALKRGYVVTLDYGYTGRELARFPRGTLMSYRRHRALDDVLQAPGEQDITAHVAWDQLRRMARELGWRELYWERMSRFLLRAGQRDQFAAALQASSEAAALRLRLQLKSLLFDLGESFDALVWSKAIEHAGRP
jgi:SAM-dependent MidA family methyltransferase